MDKVNVSLDLDGVVYDYHSTVLDHYIGTEKYDGTFEDFWCDYIPSLSKQEQDYIISIPMFYESMMVDSEALEYLNKLSEIANIYYITARSTDLQRVTERWLRKNKIPQDYNLIMTKDKLSYIKLLKIDYFVDDFVSQIEKTKNFCTSFLFAQPWNKEHQDKYNTIGSIKEFYNIVKENINGS